MYLLVGLGWLLMFFADFFSKEKLDWISFSKLIFPLLSILLYFFNKKRAYINIHNGYISANSIFEKKMKLDEIKGMRKYAGDYILKTEKAELTINTQLIDDKSLEMLDKEIEKLNIT